MKSVLLVDIGNTNITVGAGRGGRISSVRRFPTAEKRTTPPDARLKGLIHRHNADDAVLCSVVPEYSLQWRRAIAKLTRKNPLVVDHRLNLGVRISYPRPSTIGADRLANACAVYEKYGAPAIVADFGTALTFDVISPEGAYVGGVIAPGLPFMTRYLSEKTALLPEITLKGPCPCIGKSTKTAMRTGARTGCRGMVREIVTGIKSGLRVKNVKLCATGGYARWAMGDLDMPFTIDKNLTIYGLYRIYELNRSRAAGSDRK
ncbi:MAG: type III pantothenate kinase [Kiritimatiellia bacterium]